MKNTSFCILSIVLCMVFNGYCEQLGKNKTKLYKTRTQSYVTRLHPGQDIMETLTQLLSHRQHRAITITSATGSVLHCHIRFANMSTLSYVAGPLQITSITGTFDRNLKPHLHIAVADGTGKAYGGHLPSLSQRQHSKIKYNQKQSKIDSIRFDCPIYTTLQLSLNVYKDVVFQRKLDPQTTYDELTIMSYTQPYWIKYLNLLSQQDKQQFD